MKGKGMEKFFRFFDYWENVTKKRTVLKKSFSIRPRVVFVVFAKNYAKRLVEFIFRANANANAANAPAPHVLKVFLHVFRAFFRVKIALSVRGRQRTVDRAGRAGGLATLTVAAPVFDDGTFAYKGHIRQNGGESNLAAILLGEE